MAKRNLDRPGISIDECEGETFAAWVLSADLMHQTGLRFCGRVTARYWKASVSFNSVSRSWLLNAVNLRAEISTAIPDVFCFLVSLLLLPCKPLESDTWQSNSALHIALRGCVICVVHELSWLRTVWSIHRYALKILFWVFHSNLCLFISNENISLER